MDNSVSIPLSDNPIRENVKGMKGWLKLLGILQIVSGIIQALTIFGVIWAWLPIWLGVILNSASNKADEYLKNGTPEALSAFTGKLKLYFIINGIMMIISLAVIALSLVVLFILAALGVLSLPTLLDSLSS